MLQGIPGIGPILQFGEFLSGLGSKQTDRAIGILQQLVKNPTKTIKGVILTWIVATILGIIEALNKAIFRFFNGLADLIGRILGELSLIVVVPLRQFFIVGETLMSVLETVAGQTGPFEPVVLVAGYITLAYISYELFVRGLQIILEIVGGIIQVDIMDIWDRIRGR